MINLAGRADADNMITWELIRCGINRINVERTQSEVPYTVEGRLGDFKFRRAWYYWIVEGKVPLAVANKLYEDPVGVTDIRVNGNCGCPSPSGSQIDWETKNGIKLISREEYNSTKEILETTKSDYMKETAKQILSECKILEDESEPVGWVDLYHVDSELGLYIFVQTLRSEGLV